jgi:hypothetical protein
MANFFLYKFKGIQSREEPRRDTSVKWFFLPYHRIQDKKGFPSCFYFGRTLAAFRLFGECAKIVHLFMRTWVNISTMWDGVLNPGHKRTKWNYSLACLTEKFHSAYSANLSFYHGYRTEWAKNIISRSCPFEDNWDGFDWLYEALVISIIHTPLIWLLSWVCPI